MDLYESTLVSLVRALDELHEIIDPFKEFTSLGHEEPAYRGLKRWARNHRGIMDFYVFKEIERVIEECDKDPHSDLEIDLIKSILEENANGTDLIDYAEEVAGFPSSWNSSFPYFEDCEKKIERIRRSLAKREPGKDKGYVYILTNISMPGLVKIGFTHRDPKERLDELSNHTGIPTPFQLSFSKWVLNCALVEETTHKKLDQYRVSRDREFFRVKLEEAVEAVEAAIREVYA